ncbi:MAG: methionine synthase [Acidobacteria bacterium]|nr:methionine synthase [Acidobacteriota bacterium]
MTERIQILNTLLQQRILVLDGAMGTAIQACSLGPDDFGGADYEGCNEFLALTRPDVIADIHRGYLEVGADILETNTFGSTELVLAEYGLEQRAFEITAAAARLARSLCDEFSTEDHPRFVAGAMGPTTRAISVTGGVSFQELVHHFGKQAHALLCGGVDYLLLETGQDLRNIKAGLIGVQDAFRELGFSVPVAVSVTIEPMGTTLAGQAIDAVVTSLEHFPLLYIGLNCSTGPELMTDHIRTLSELARTRVACLPNAGLPDEEGRYLETPAMIAGVLSRFIDEGWLNLVGGCCGTTAQHVAALVQAVEGRAPRPIPVHQRVFLSGIENLEIEEATRPVLVGERTNVLGSRVFKQLIAESRFEEASEIARRQVRNGAQVIDICLQDPDRDEAADMRRFLSHVITKVKVPLMIDTTDAAVMEEALTFCQGKSVLNSINLEDGEERFRRVVPLAKKFGAALVVGTIDEDRQKGMAVTRERKQAIALRSYNLLVHEYGVRPTDIFIDPLVFPCATGDANYLGSARETIEALRLIKQELPLCKTILGISNVSFGLPPAGREVLNSVFLYHCTKAGLDLAIVNSEKLERYASIPAEEKELADKVLFHTSEETVTAFVNHFRGASRPKRESSQLPLDDRLSAYIVEGSKDGLIEDLTAKLKEATPLEIINGPLMRGMDEVGRLFNNNELIVAEVLQSAEAMKAAVAFLEPYMERAESASRGKVLLATVKGDVHDIGKNLVDIILSNNGYQVINLGIKVPPHDLIEAIRKHEPDLIGLSGLLVKSAQQMVVTAAELSQAGATVPMLVGGAALSRAFTHLRIGPAYKGIVAYAEDAMSGLELARRLLDPERRTILVQELQKERAAVERQRAGRGSTAPVVFPAQRSVSLLDTPPTPPDFKRHVLRNIRLDEVWPYVNPSMLYGKHMGLKGGVSSLLATGDEKARMLQELFESLKEECRRGLMQAHAVWQFFRALSDQDSILLLNDGGDVLCQFEFPRQSGPPGLCLADYVIPKGDNSRPSDSICLFAVTAGLGIRQAYEAYKKQGEYLKSHAVQALAVETAEALAEWLHAKLRGLWGFPDPATVTIQDRLQGRYRGKRYSFGYPACPDLSDQKKLWSLLQPEEIGIALTEEYMMEPEASVSALVLHHPQARYFAVREAIASAEEHDGG